MSKTIFRPVILQNLKKKYSEDQIENLGTFSQEMINALEQGKPSKLEYILGYTVGASNITKKICNWENALKFVKINEEGIDSLMEYYQNTVGNQNIKWDIINKKALGNFILTSATYLTTNVGVLIYDFFEKL